MASDEELDVGREMALDKLAAWGFERSDFDGAPNQTLAAVLRFAADQAARHAQERAYDRETIRRFVHFFSEAGE